VTSPIRYTGYTVFAKNPAAHLFEVTVTVDDPLAAGQRFMLPSWIPGSYMIREFARHIVTLRAHANGAPIKCEKIDKATWQCAPCAGPLTLTYEVYAWDLNVRAAHLDDTHAFFNGPCLLLLPEGMRDRRCELAIRAPAGTAHWHIATALAQSPLSTVDSTPTPSNTPPILGFGHEGVRTYYASTYDELIDHPVEMGTFSFANFTAHGVPHHVALTGASRCDLARLCADLKKICETEIAFFEPVTKQAPFAEYWFLITATADGFGGLEHRASTALLVTRDDLPLAHEAKMSAGYRKTLSLAAHEYFHAWNVKRIKPATFTEHDLSRENYTAQLWFFEGFTDYYDDLMLLRAGLIAPLEYLEIEAENIGRVMAQSGRTKQSLAESSFDAWVKYYRQDENAPNAIVSYYQKGAIAGLALDLTIREKTNGATSLDDVMRALWNDYAKKNRGLEEGEIERVVSRVAGVNLDDFFQRVIYGTEDPALQKLFAHVGIVMEFKLPGLPKAGETIPSALGAKIGADSNGDAKLAQVLDDGAAQRAGLAAGDVIVAIDHLRVTAQSLERRIRSYPPGSVIDVAAFRRDMLRHVSVTLLAQPATTCTFVTHDAPPEAKARRLQWLQAPTA
jgi:predicted metalloprotease with PDZ domain